MSGWVSNIPMRLVKIGRRGVKLAGGNTVWIRKQKARGIPHPVIVALQKGAIVDELILLPHPQRHLCTGGDGARVVVRPGVFATADALTLKPILVLITRTVESESLRDADARTAPHMPSRPMCNILEVVVV